MLRARRARQAAGAYLWIAITGVLTGLATLAHENAALFVLPLGAAAWSVARARTGAAGGRARGRPGLRAVAAPVGMDEGVLGQHTAEILKEIGEG